MDFLSLPCEVVKHFSGGLEPRRMGVIFCMAKKIRGKTFEGQVIPAYSGFNDECTEWVCSEAA